MILDLYFANPQLLWAIPLVLLLGAAFIRTRSRNRLFAVSRLLAFCLIIAAAANPYFVEVHTVPVAKAQHHHLRRSDRIYGHLRH